MSSPGITVMSFTSQGGQSFGDYIRYESRNIATNMNAQDVQRYNKNRTQGYLNYMTNPTKTNRNANDLLEDQAVKNNVIYGTNMNGKIDVTNHDKENFANKITDLQQQKNIYMYQDVYSFDNSWLEENGLYDSKTDQLNHKQLLTYANAAEQKMITNENLSAKTMYFMGIHRNTDNIHIHVATFDPEQPPGKDFKRNMTSILQAKSVLANKIITDEYRNNLQKNIDQQRSHLKSKIRENVREINSPKQKSRAKDVIEDQKKLKEIGKALPDNYNKIKRKSRSNAKTMKKAKELSRDYVMWYYKKNQPEQLKDFQKSLRQELKYNERIYGKKPQWKSKKVKILSGIKQNKRTFQLNVTHKGLQEKQNGQKIKNYEVIKQPQVKFKLSNSDQNVDKLNANKVEKTKLLDRPYLANKGASERFLVQKGKYTQTVLRISQKPKMRHREKIQGYKNIQQLLKSNSLSEKQTAHLLSKHDAYNAPTLNKKWGRFMNQAQNIVLDQAYANQHDEWPKTMKNDQTQQRLKPIEHKLSPQKIEQLLDKIDQATKGSSQQMAAEHLDKNVDQRLAKEQRKAQHQIKQSVSQQIHTQNGYHKNYGKQQSHKSPIRSFDSNGVNFNELSKAQRITQEGNQTRNRRAQHSPRSLKTFLKSTLHSSQARVQTMDEEQKIQRARLIKQRAQQQAHEEEIIEF